MSIPGIETVAATSMMSLDAQEQQKRNSGLRLDPNPSYQNIPLQSMSQHGGDNARSKRIEHMF